MTNRNKGSQNELFVQKWFENKGFTVHRAYPSIYKAGRGIFCRSNDIFQAFDLCCKKGGFPTVWVQVSSGPRLAEKSKKISKLGNIWNEGDEIEIWLAMGQGVWKRYQMERISGGRGEFKEVMKIERGKEYSLCG